MGELAKLLRLSASERGDLLRAALLLPWIALCLKWRGLGRTRARPLHTHSVQAPADASARALQIARMVSVAARRGPYPANCLVRSLALERLLARAGIPAELRLGVRKVEERLQAHAWIEHAGRPLSEPAEVANMFPPFGALSSPPRQ